MDWKSGLIGLAVGMVAVGVPAIMLTHHDNHAPVEATQGAKTMYTCTMHPSVKQDHPGKCPICGMDLVPMGHHHAASDEANPDAVMLSDEAAALANIETQVVGSGAASKDIRLFGKVQADERLQQTQAAYVSGRIERLMINAVGDRVARGQTLAVIYSPELYSAEQELVSALGFPAGEQRKALVEAAIEKLRLLNITPTQINEVIRNKKASPYVSLKANTSGTVVDKQIAQGDYVKQGQPLLKIADLSRVWVMFQAYEGDLPFVKVGEIIHFTSEAMPGKTFAGKVSFIDPLLDPKSRTAGVRVVMANPGGMFKPEMIVTGNAAANMKQYGDEIVVPKSAVLWTGKRSVVYVKDDSGDMPAYELRQVTLGPTLPDGYVITDGLAEGEEIVTNGAFAIDASAQLAGKRSMMNQE
ncbi:MAG: efflux RND transporter periplasmic adaptor subunit [Prevotella sp.]|nr:efflux RND transporter periplasmic adaptor subunit [Prevotella sp.]